MLLCAEPQHIHQPTAKRGICHSICAWGETIYMVHYFNNNNCRYLPPSKGMLRWSRGPHTNPFLGIRDHRLAPIKHVSLLRSSPVRANNSASMSQWGGTLRLSSSRCMKVKLAGILQKTVLYRDDLILLFPPLQAFLTLVSVSRTQAPPAHHPPKYRWWKAPKFGVSKTWRMKLCQSMGLTFIAVQKSDLTVQQVGKIHLTIQLEKQLLVKETVIKERW